MADIPEFRAIFDMHLRFVWTQNTQHYSPEELIGIPCSKVLTPNEVPQFMRFWGQVCSDDSTSGVFYMDHAHEETFFLEMFRFEQRVGCVARLIPQEIVSLTPREGEILRLLAKGLTQPAIARMVDLKTTTVTTFSARLKEKIGIGTQAELIAFAGRHHREIAAYESWRDLST